MQTENHHNAVADITLPPWRREEIISIAVDTFLAIKTGSDIKAHIRSEGIVLREYSAFDPENLKKLQEDFPKNHWKAGFFCQETDPQTGKICRIIVYNDSYNETIQLHIILHEYGHAVLRHTEQCILAEQEALCFAVVMMLLLKLDDAFSLRSMFHNNKIIQSGGAMKHVSA